MRVYNYSEARQNFSSVLNLAMNEEVIIARKDGSRFKVVPIKEKDEKSPFDIDGINTNIDMAEIIDVLKESRET